MTEGPPAQETKARSQKPETRTQNNPFLGSGFWFLVSNDVWWRSCNGIVQMRRIASGYLGNSRYETGRREWGAGEDKPYRAEFDRETWRRDSERWRMSEPGGREPE